MLVGAKNVVEDELDRWALSIRNLGDFVQFFMFSPPEIDLNLQGWILAVLRGSSMGVSR